MLYCYHFIPYGFCTTRQFNTENKIMADIVIKNRGFVCKFETYKLYSLK